MYNRLLKRYAYESVLCSQRMCVIHVIFTRHVMSFKAGGVTGRSACCLVHFLQSRLNYFTGHSSTSCFLCAHWLAGLGESALASWQCSTASWTVGKTMSKVTGPLKNCRVLRSRSRVPVQRHTRTWSVHNIFYIIVHFVFTWDFGLTAASSEHDFHIYDCKLFNNLPNKNTSHTLTTQRETLLSARNKTLMLLEETNRESGVMKRSYCYRYRRSHYSAFWSAYSACTTAIYRQFYSFIQWYIFFFFHLAITFHKS